MSRVWLAGVALALLCAPPAAACLWDHDTLKEESLQLGDVADVVSGRVRKHSTFFYQQKILYTAPLLKEDRLRPELFDDLAVAHDKLGQHDQALSVMADKERRFPGAYTTYSNMGTFYAHQGQYDQALAYLRKALQINPKAHFGREKYQLKLIQFLQREAAQQGDGSADLLGLSFGARAGDPERAGQAADADWPLRAGSRQHLREAGLDEDVLVALAGLIRFGSSDRSPHLWFALGNALALRGHKHLSLRAYRQAEVLGHPRAARHAIVVAMHVHGLRVMIDANDTDRALRGWQLLCKQELDPEFARGQAWARREQEQEDARIRRGQARQVFGY